MSVTTPAVQDWNKLLRNLALGGSIASFILVPSAGYSMSQTEQRVVQDTIVIMSTSADATFDFRTVRIRTPHGLEIPTFPLSPAVTNDAIEKDSIPLALRDMTGLPVETLASLVHVSRNAYYKWLDGKGVSDEHEARLTELFNTCSTLRDLLGSHLKEFLETPGPAGRPVDLLAQGDSAAVIGLALRPPSEPIHAAHESQFVRRASSLSGWLRPAARLGWGAPRLTDAEQEEALYRLGPRPVSHDVEPYDTFDEDAEAFVAWGFVLE